MQAIVLTVIEEYRLMNTNRACTLPPEHELTATAPRSVPSSPKEPVMPTNQPRLMLDTTNVIFELSDDVMPKLDDKTRTQKLDRETGLPL
jgi:hypothetical protein